MAKLRWMNGFKSQKATSGVKRSNKIHPCPFFNSIFKHWGQVKPRENTESQLFDFQEWGGYCTDQSVLNDWWAFIFSLPTFWPSFTSRVKSRPKSEELMVASRSWDSYDSLDQTKETTHDDLVFGTALALVKTSTTEHFMHQADPWTDNRLTMRSRHPMSVRVSARPLDWIYGSFFKQTGPISRLLFFNIV